MKGQGLFAGTFCILFGIVVFTGCVKDLPEDKPKKSTYRIEDNELEPMQIGSIISTDKINDESYVGEVNGQKVDFVRASDTQLVFLCPVLPSGSYNAKVEGLFELGFSVNAGPAITNPDAELAFFYKELSEFKTEMSKQTSPRQDIADAIDYFRGELDKLLAGMTNEQKLALAYTLRSNQMLNPDFSQYDVREIPDSFYHKKAVYFDPSDAASKFIAKFTVAKTKAVVLLLTSAKLFMVPSPDLLTKGSATIFGLGALVQIAKIKGYIDEDLGNLFMAINGVTAFNKTEPKIVFKNKELVPISITGNFRTLVDYDRTAGAFPSFFSVFDQVNSAVAIFYTGYIKAASWFTSSQPALNEAAFSIPGTAKTKDFKMDLSRLTIKQPTEPGVSLNIQKSGGQLNLAVITDLVGEVDFTIEMQYNDPYLYPDQATLYASRTTIIAAKYFKPISIYDGMVLVDSGSFMMGSETGKLDEKPVHKVTITKPFQISKYEIDQSQWEQVMGVKHSSYSTACPTCPVINLTLLEAFEFCNKLNENRKPSDGLFGIPTEAEWEFAARGGKLSKGYLYSGSSNVDEVAWVETNSKYTRQPVGKKKPNELGIYDMSGNVWEWCSDDYAAYPDSAVVDPTVSVPNSIHTIIRGGSHSVADSRSTVTSRNSMWATAPSGSVGFRVVIRY